MFTRETYASFMAWISVKISLHRKQMPPSFKEGEMWWCSIGMNVGQEIFGKGDYFARPVLILKKLTSRLFLGLPLTSKNKRGDWHIEVMYRDKKRVAILSQARALDSRRLLRPIGTLSNDALRRISTSFIEFYRPK